MLGNSGLATPPLVLGGNVFGWTADKETSFAVLDAFVAGGGTMIDTADVYSGWVPGNSGGESETIIGEWMKARGNRERVLIATKGGYYDGIGADALANAADASLRRLQTDRIDLYYTHKDDPAVAHEVYLGALDRLVRAGKVRAIGASQISAERLEQSLETSKANGLAAYGVLQTWYNLLERERYEGELRDVVVRHGLGMASFYSLASGYLTGKYRVRSDLGKSVRGGGVQAYFEGKGPEVLAALDEVAAELGATPAQAALAWTTAQPGVTAPIASATNVDQMAELLAASELRLSRDQIDRIDQASR
ncbi:MAG: alcohol dehydrogenase [Alphaproteobacteria bacterium]|nr:alcohol dehydrogenase [Alphaproteobacteria bacterium]